MVAIPDAVVYECAVVVKTFPTFVAVVAVSRVFRAQVLALNAYVI